MRQFKITISIFGVRRVANVKADSLEAAIQKVRQRIASEVAVESAQTKEEADFQDVSRAFKDFFNLNL